MPVSSSLPVPRVTQPHTRLQGVLLAVFAAFYLQHVLSMAMVKFDYGYNMKVNVAVGGSNCIAWLLWFAVHR